MRRSAVAVLITILGLLFAAPALALEPRTGDVVAVPTGETLRDDLFAAASRVTVDGRVDGDVYAVAQWIAVAGTIEGDLIGAAEWVEIRGTVRGDVRVAGAQVDVAGRVERNVLAAAQSLRVSGPVDGSLTGAADTLLLGGPIGRSAAFAADEARVQGQIGGDLRARVDRLRLLPSARVAGDLEYWSEREAEVPSGTVVGQITRHEPEQRDLGHRVGEALEQVGRALTIGWFVGSLIVGALLMRLIPEAPGAAAVQIRGRPLATFGVGLALLIGLPIVGILLALTLVGLPLALLLLGLWTLGVFVGWLVAAAGLATLLVGRVGASVGHPVLLHPSLLAVAGLALLWMVGQVPLLGGLVAFGVACLGLGFLTTALWRLRRRSVEQPDEAAAGP